MVKITAARASVSGSSTSRHISQMLQLIATSLLISARGEQQTPSVTFSYSKFTNMATRFFEVEEPLSVKITSLVYGHQVKVEVADCVLF